MKQFLLDLVRMVSGCSIAEQQSGSSSSQGNTMIRSLSNFSDEISIHHRSNRRKIDMVTDEIALALDRTKTSS